ncbi:MAG: SDR family oxidoreductase [Chloroflexota bacterium]
MQILITGASGLLGLNLALEAAKKHTVFGVAHSHYLKSKAFTALREDLLKPGAMDNILDQVKPDWVIHCAALANLEVCEKNPDLARQLNTELPRNLAEKCRKGGARLVHISTDAVFDGQKGQYTEEDHPKPLSVYARTKLAGEHAVATENPEAIIARVNFYGWSLSGQRSLAEWFLNNLRHGSHIKGFTDVIFSPLLANDLARLLLKMLKTKLSGLYHVVSSDCLSKYDFGVALARQFGLDETLIEPSSVATAGMKASRSPNLSLSVMKLAKALGEAPPRVSLGIKRFHHLYQQGYPLQLTSLASSL